MAIDAVSVSLSGMSTPVGNDSVATLTATAVTTLAGSPTNATRVEFELLYCPLVTGEGQGALKEVVSRTSDSSASPTGTYSVTFASSLFTDPGLYQVQAKAIVGSGSPEVISNMETAKSSEIRVTETLAQSLEDVKDELVSINETLDDHEDRLDALEAP